MPEELSKRLQAMLGVAYRVEHELPGGGMSRVYLAHDIALKRDVVIKVLPPDLISDASMIRFKREIEVTALLQHPHILPIITSGGAGDLLYYVTPFIRGESLRDLLAATPKLPLDDGVRLLAQLLGAVAFAHARGVVHRDIKPANVLLSEGHAILADFGIARALASPDDDQVTASGTVIGTPVYMAPERPRDEHADIYAVAVMAHEMLTGSVPLKDRSAESITATFAACVPRPQASRAKRVARAVAQALALDPSKRFRTARDFRDALERSLATGSPAGRLRTAAAMVVVAATAVFGGRELTKRREAAVKSASLGRIVVAPLQNFTGVDSLGVVGMMAGDWITEGLEKTGIVEVVPTTSAVSAFRYASSDSGSHSTLVSPKVLAQETGAVTVVYGALYRVRSRLEFRITVADQNGSRVVGTITDVSAPTNDPISGVNEVRTRVMGWLASHYDDRLEAFATSSVRPPTYDAYLAFSEGMDRYTAIDFASALPLFVRAARIDSSFTVAPLYASICMTNLGQWVSADSLLRIVGAHRRDLNAYHQAWLDYRVAFIHGDNTAALAAIRIAAKLAPGSKAAYNHAVVAFQTGHLDEALQTVESIRPDRGPMRGFAEYWVLYGAILHALGQYDREREIGTLALREHPDRLTALTPIARSLAASGKLDELGRATRDLSGLRSDPNYWDQGHFLVEIGEELRAHGHPAEAEKYFDRAQTWLRDHSGSQWRLAEVLYALGRWTEAGAVLSAARHSAPDNVDLLGAAGLVAARTGQLEASTAIADSLAHRHRPYELGAASLYQARIAAVLGNREGALARLRDSFAEGKAYDLWMHRNLDLQTLRGNEPFDLLVRGKQ